MVDFNYKDCMENFPVFAGNEKMDNGKQDSAIGYWVEGGRGNWAFCWIISLYRFLSGFD